VSVTDIFRTMDWGPAPEAAAPAVEWLETHSRKLGLFVGGEWLDPHEGGYFETHNPAKGEVIAQIAQATSSDVDRAVEAASQAQPLWEALGGHGRARFLYAIARQIQKNSRFLAVLETIDNGKPIRETRDLDIPLAARHFYYHAGWAQLRDSELPGYEPVGVCGQIIPWNFPLLMLAWKIAPALAMGNTVILKPAEFTSLTALAFAEICERVGLPRGVVNIVTGDGSTGKLIVEHPGIHKIAFTGSTEVGRIIRKSTAGTGKALSLELGGKSPFIVFEDADLDSAVEGLVDAIWFNQGQVCCAGSRLLVQESVAGRVIEKVKARMEKLRVGDPLDKAIDLGAIVDPIQLQRITELVTQGSAEGASVFQPENWNCPPQGCFYPPTLLTNVSPASTVAQVEIFGPVLVTLTFKNPSEAVEIANNTDYGLAASVWTENINLAHDIAGRVKTGTVWINCTNQFDAASGFGGYRESGFGREGGKEGLFGYLRVEERGKRKEERPEGTETPTPNAQRPSASPMDRTHKMYIGGKQVRPDGGLSLQIGGDEVGRGNRKDIRNAVEAAIAAQKSWSSATASLRSQVLYYLAENLEAARAQVGATVSDGEFEAAIQSVFTFAAKADKFDGAVHPAPLKGIVYTQNEPIGVIGIVCGEEASLTGLLAPICAAISMGNSVVIVPSEQNPLPAVELYRVLDTSDVPSGVVNIVTGLQDELVPSLAGHDGVDSIWYFGQTLGGEIERLSIGNLKQTWVEPNIDWLSDPLNHPNRFLRHATQVKNIWTPVGE
jgi:aldehyde dehydrogenase (NAD+)